ncbi:MAG: hypothetical protein GY811_09035 [Myxococcales bacterium]|nr:hypothetical protein [Myxococcales bacterium]
MKISSTPATQSALIFPRDEGWHSVGPLGVANPSLNNMEWLYTNLHLTDEEGNHIVVFVAYFTQGLRLATVRRFDSEWRSLDEYQGTAMGLLRPSPHKLDLKYKHPHGNDHWCALDSPHSSRLEVYGGEFSLDLEMHTTRPPYAAGDTGYMPFSSDGWFYYYSLTRLEVSGTITLSGKQHTVGGLGWVDHQWGPFFVTPARYPRRYEQYEWFSIQLEDGNDFLLTTVWTAEGQLPDRDAYGGAGWVRADGSSEHLVGSQTLRRTHFSRAPSTGVVHAAGWRFVAPEWDVDLTIRPRAPNQMASFAPQLPKQKRYAGIKMLAPFTDWLAAFWEGTCSVEGHVGGKAVSGHCFAELIKRYDQPKVHFERTLIRKEVSPPIAVVRWRVDSWDPAAPLLCRVQVYDSEGGCVAQGDDLDVSVFCFRPEAPGLHEIIVEAHSVDHTLRGEDRTTLLIEDYE